MLWVIMSLCAILSFTCDSIVKVDRIDCYLIIGNCRSCVNKEIMILDSIRTIYGDIHVYIVADRTIEANTMIKRLEKRGYRTKYINTKIARDRGICNNGHIRIFIHRKVFNFNLYSHKIWHELGTLENI